MVLTISATFVIYSLVLCIRAAIEIFFFFNI